jgi:hypothetical protein
MSNNYQRNQFPNNPRVSPGLLDSTTGASDALLVTQQNTYAASVDNYIANLASERAQKRALALVEASPMTLAGAQVYYADVSASFWSGPGIIDWKKAYNSIVATI